MKLVLSAEKRVIDDKHGCGAKARATEHVKMVPGTEKFIIY